MPLSHAFLKFTRLIHLYLGVFTAPALIFFAFTGALQTFSLHETTRGSSYKPPVWAVTLAQLHKKQTTVVPVRKLPPQDKPADKATDKLTDKLTDKSIDKPAADKTQPTPSTPSAQTAAPQKPADTPKPHNTLPLKIFFLLVAIGLFISTISGLYMSYKFIRNKRLITATLIAGVIIPILLALA